ncbi:MAG: hypothetical protein FVQ83_10150 [Chloroflexi bacterium]|nr:hypothetical protein [Chloroflexota bacterium]
MKTQIIQLEEYDDFASARDKIGWGQGDRILLVWPRKGIHLDRKLDLVLLQRYCNTLGSQFALVSRNRIVKARALQLDIPVFRSMRLAQRTPWETGIPEDKEEKRKPSKSRLNELREKLIQPPPKQRLESPRARWTIFGIGVTAFLALSSVVLPRAEIHLQPQSDIQEINLEVEANPLIPSYNLSGALPALAVKVVVEGRDSLQTQDTIQIPYQTATGRITFTNLTDQPVSVPEGTVIRSVQDETPNFITTVSGELSGEVQETLNLPVEAMNPGVAGNLPRDSLLVIDGYLGLSVSVSNQEAISGGSDRTAPAPSSQDYIDLKSQLIESLSLNAIEEILSSSQPNDFVIPSIFSAGNVLIEEFTPAEPLPANELNLIMQVEFEILIVDWDDLQGMAAVILDGNLESGQIPQAETLEIEHLTTPVINANGIATWEIVIRRNITSEISTPQVLSLAMGSSLDSTSRDLEQAFDLESAPEIIIFPGWWPRLPVLPFRILVINEN